MAYTERDTRTYLISSIRRHMYQLNLSKDEFHALTESLDFDIRNIESQSTAFLEVTQARIYGALQYHKLLEGRSAK